MDDTEQFASQYLAQRGFSNVVFEPDGNVPPDFLCDQRVAVEVRRLNQLERGPATNPGALDEIAIPLHQGVCEVLRSFGKPVDSHTGIVYYRFRRPLPRRRRLRELIRRDLEAFLRSKPRTRTDISVCPAFDMTIYPASTIINDQCFVVFGYTDRDASGWLLADLDSSLRKSIDEKTAKIASVRHRYPEWWLLLVDHVALGLNDFERELFRDAISIDHSWDKVILIDPRDPARDFVI